VLQLLRPQPPVHCLPLHTQVQSRQNLQELLLQHLAVGWHCRQAQTPQTLKRQLLQHLADKYHLLVAAVQ
jgi:hypothetical protein